MNGCLGARTAGWMYEKTNADVGRTSAGLRLLGVFDGDVKWTYV